MTHIAYVLPKVRTAKDVVRKMYKKLGFSASFDSQYAKVPKTLLESLSYFLISQREMELKNVSLSDI